MSVARHLPRMRPLSPRKSAVVSAIDVGTSKVVCLIARLDPNGKTGGWRTHDARILGIGHQRARGLKGGQIVDMDQAEMAIRLAVDAAERMAGAQVEASIVSFAGGRIGSQHFTARVPIADGSVAEQDIHRVLEASCLRTTPEGRATLHSSPTCFQVDEADGIRDPKGMVGAKLGANLHVASCDLAAVANLGLAVERCHLSVEAFVAAPYASALATLTDDEAEIGATVLDFGGGTTSVAVFVNGALAHLDAIALGGQHVTLDIARGLNIRLSAAERLKTLYGGVLPSAADDRETFAIEQVGEDSGRPNHLPRAQLVRIIRPRVEETMELIRDRLRRAGHPTHTGARLVVTGGASQLAGLVETARRVFGAQVRVGRPGAAAGLPDSAKTAAFAAPAGLLVYPQAAFHEHFEPSRPGYQAAVGGGYFARVGRWLKDSF